MKKPGRTYVLQQDEHLQNLRKIIKRDFFSTSSQNQKSNTIQLSLNEYISNFKSNENRTFSELVQADKQKWKSQHWWFDKQDKLLMLEREKLQAVKGKNSQYQNMIKQMDPKNNLIALANQQAKNSIFFNRDNNFGSYLTEDSEQAKKINYQNVRLKSQQQKQRQKQNKNKDSDEQNDQNPMTWGQVQGTPLRIKEQSQYRIPDRPNKDILLDKLNQKMHKGRVEAQKSSRKSVLMMKIIGSSTPSYKSSSYLRNSSIRRAKLPQTPLNTKKAQKPPKQQMEGLLSFKK